MNKKPLAGAAAAFALFTAGCSPSETDSPPPQPGDIEVSEQDQTVTQTKAYKDQKGFLYKKERVWEFGEVRQVCDIENLSVAEVFGVETLYSKTCHGLEHADPKKVEEMRAKLEDASPAP